MIRAFNSQQIQPPRGAEELFRLPSDLSPETPIDLEIGCGVGWHPLRYTEENPERFLIAIERTATKFNKFQRRLLKHSPRTNLLAVHADVVPWLVHCLPENILNRIIILYPNPYPKNPSARFFKMPFFAELLKRGRADLTIHLATNEDFYQKEALRAAQQDWGLELIHHQVLTSENFPKPRTHFEKKYLERGEVCYDLAFRRVQV